MQFSYKKQALPPILIPRLYLQKCHFMPKIYGLGGINLDNLKKLRKIGVAGFGAIDLFKNFL